MIQDILLYLQNHSDVLIQSIYDHIQISVYAFSIAVLIGVTLGLFGVYFKKSQKGLETFFQTLRVIPSLAILLLMLPILGTGLVPALVALVILAIPPILMNTMAGIKGVPDFMVETAISCGMTQKQVWFKVKIPLALPLILAGLRTALIEIIASATLAAKIGAGGLGEIIFTGLGLNRADLLVIGGFSVTLLSLGMSYLFVITEKFLFQYKTI